MIDPFVKKAVASGLTQTAYLTKKLDYDATDQERNRPG
jgi:hypothetical protein